MSAPDDEKKKTKNRQYLSWGAPDEDGKVAPPHKRKARSSQYLRWGDPEEHEETVPRKTFIRLSTTQTSAQQVALCSTVQQCHDFDSGLSENIGLTGDTVNNPATSTCKNDEYSDTACSDTEYCSSTYADSSENGNEDLGPTDVTDCVTINSSEDENKDMEPPEMHFIPIDNPLDQPLGPVLTSTSSSPHLEVEPTEELLNSEESPLLNVSEEVTAPIPVLPRINSTIPAYISTLTRLMDPKFTNNVQSTVCVTPREILLNILNLTEAHDVNNTLFVGICKLVNSIFPEPILPDTSFKLDSLLLSTCGIQYHFYCSKCQGLLHNPNLNELVTCKCKFVNNVSDLTAASYFVSFEICTQLELILRDPNIASKLIDVKSYRIQPGMRDLYDGEVFQNFIKFLKLLDVKDDARHISFVFCFDGSPLYKSSDSEVWPLLGIINELPPLDRMKNTFLIGLWFGSKKPNFKSFFQPIVQRLTCLSNERFTINIGGKETEVKIHCIRGCVDSGARGPIQGIHLHNGRYGCSWCLHPGETEGGGSSARKYRYLEDVPVLRTHEQVRNDAEAVKKLPRRASFAPRPHVHGVVASSPLLKLPTFDIMDGMVVDAMHNSFLGVTRQFLRLWCGTDGNVKLPDGTLPIYYIGSPSTVEKIDLRVAGLIPPIEIRRLPRPISDLVHFKARELENFLLYFLVPVLRGILNERFLKHMALYAQGMYLLSKDIVLPEDLDTAEFLLNQFVREIKVLYVNENFSDFKQYTYNVHLSLHAVQNARRWGNAWSMSGYAFENGIGVLKKVVHANKGVPIQIARALCKTNVKNLLLQEISSARCASFLQQIKPQKSVNVTFINNVKIFGVTAADFHPNDEEAYLLDELSLKADEFVMAKKILFNHSVFALRVKNSRTRNDFAQLTDGNIVQIRKIIVSETLQSVLVFCSCVHVVPYYSVHLPSHLTLTSPFMFSVQLIEQEQQLVAYHVLSKPCVYSNLKSVGGEETVSVMANVFNIF